MTGVKRFSVTISGLAIVSAVVLAGMPPIGRSADDLRSPAFAEIESPAEENSRVPNLVSGPDGVYLSWMSPMPKGESVLRFSSWNRGKWSVPKSVVSGPSFLTNWADFPSLLAASEGTLVAHWLLRTAGGHAYDILTARSTDGGNSWSSAQRPHSDGTHTEHGFVSMVDIKAGKFGVVWLDGRMYAPAEGKASNEMALMFTVHEDGSYRKEIVLDPKVCDCCQTAAAVTADGGIFVAYRDRSDSEVRDISYVRYAGGKWTEPMTLHPDGWTIAACPVNGPAVSAEGNRIAVAWLTMSPKPMVQILFSTDSGRTFSAPVRVDQGNPAGRVAVQWRSDGSCLVSWIERTEGTAAELRVRAMRPEERPSDYSTVAKTTSARPSGFPRMARFGNEILIAWTEVAEPFRVRVARIRD